MSDLLLLILWFLSLTIYIIFLDRILDTVDKLCNYFLKIVNKYDKEHK